MPATHADPLLEILDSLRPDLPVVTWRGTTHGMQQDWLDGRPLTVGRLRTLLGRGVAAVPPGSTLAKGSWLRGRGEFAEAGAGWRVKAVRVVPADSAEVA